MKIFVYSMRKFDELGFYEKFSREYGVEFDYTTEYPSRENLELARGAQAVSIITTDTDAVMLDRLKEMGVRTVATRTIGYDHIDVEHAHAIGMNLCHVTYSPASVADYTIMLMLMGCRKISHILARSALQDYTLEGKMGVELSHCTVGVIGTGNIGRTVVRHLSGFGCRILAYDLYPNEELKQFAEYVDLETLYAQSDIITLHCPATEENYHMLGRETFGRMKKGVMVINCARGSLMDTDALIEALDCGQVGFAALDVLEHESGLYYKNHMGKALGNHRMDILKSYSNVIVSPHTAFYTDEAVSNMVENSIRGILEFENPGQKNPFAI